MNDQEKYAVYQLANQTGGPCLICDWRDGDGVRTCFYSAEVGIVSHQNSEKGAMASMDESQRNLFTRRSVLAFIDESSREKKIALVARGHAAYEERYRQTHTDASAPTRESDGTPIPFAAWVAKYREQQEKKPLATDPQYAGWIEEPWWEHIREEDFPPPELRGREKGEMPLRFVAWMVHLYEPHSCGKGYQYQKAPYHLGCTGCATEIKLWEHGVDYDVG